MRHSLYSENEMINKGQTPNSYQSMPVNINIAEGNYNVNSPQGGSSDNMMTQSHKHHFTQRVNSLKSISEEDHSSNPIPKPEN